MDYTELVKSLRIYTDEYTCVGCIKNTEGKDYCDVINCDIELVRDAADAIEELQQTAEHYKGCSDDWYREACDYKAALPKWIPVTERLPGHLTSVIVHRKDGGIFLWEYFNTSPTDECWIDDRMNVHSFYYVTHWQPLPEPPREEA